MHADLDIIPLQYVPLEENEALTQKESKPSRWHRKRPAVLGRWVNLSEMGREYSSTTRMGNYCYVPARLVCARSEISPVSNSA